MATEQYIALIIDDDSTATSELRKGLAAHPEFTVAGAATTATAGERLLFRCIGVEDYRRIRRALPADA